MIKVYGMKTCPDCEAIKSQLLERKTEFEYIDISENVKLLKEFILLRDNRQEFFEFKANNSLGIPCFLEPDGTIGFDPMDYGIIPDGYNYGQSCSYEDHLNGKNGC